MRRKQETPNGYSWRPARLTSGDMILVLWAMIVVPLSRAFDYSTGHDGSRSLTAVEQFAPLWAWSIPFYSGALVLLLGVRARWHIVVYLGHSILAVSYTALSVGITCSVLGHPWADGLRNGVGLVFPALLHWLLWWRTGPTPVLPHEARPVEIVEGPQ